MGDLYQIWIARERPEGLCRVAAHNLGDVFPQGLQTGPDLGISTVDAILEVLPQPFDWIQFRAVDRQGNEDHILRDLHALRGMCWGLIEEHDIQTLCIVAPKLPQEGREALRIDGREFPPEGLASGGFDGRIEPIVFIQGLDQLEGLHPAPGEAATGRQMQAQAAFILAEQAHRLRRLLPRKCHDRPEAARQLFDEISRRGGVFLACWGRGRLSLACNW